MRDRPSRAARRCSRERRASRLAHQQVADAADGLHGAMFSTAACDLPSARRFDLRVDAFLFWSRAPFSDPIRPATHGSSATRGLQWGRWPRGTDLRSASPLAPAIRGKIGPKTLNLKQGYGVTLRAIRNLIRYLSAHRLPTLRAWRHNVVHVCRGDQTRGPTAQKAVTGSSTGPALLARLFTGGGQKLLDQVDRGLLRGSLMAHLPGGSTRMLGGHAPGFERKSISRTGALLRLATGGSAGFTRHGTRASGTAAIRSRCSRW